MTAKEHYDQHLGNFYAWMSGDFRPRVDEFKYLLTNYGIAPTTTGEALDLGAGHGIQSVALAELGYQVLAVDFNEPLLRELRQNALGLPVQTHNADLRQVRGFARQPELINCGGDTLTHLDTRTEVQQLLLDMADVLVPGGWVVLSFRDYTVPLTGLARFIPVKSDADRILTCVLDYMPDFVEVTDLLYERTATDGWQQCISSYRKVRLSPDEVIAGLHRAGLKVTRCPVVRGVVTLLARKPVDSV